ncbi:MAG: arylsulfatase [Planctomycetota bacterium]
MTKRSTNLIVILLSIAVISAAQGQDKPNILVIMGDDIGIPNLSIYSHGLMGYRTPNIDRIGREGMLFTDYYAENSCTAGRAAFITGQTVLRTGLSRVGMPGAKEGLQDQDPTLAELLKPHGYVCGQFGKNHLGDRNEFLPTVHGFDEFFGNLYHLNAEEEPENVDYPKQPRFRNTFGPRGVLKCKATDTDDPTVDPRFGRIGKQTVVDTGPLTKKRMETVDQEFLDAALDFVDRAHKARKPFFVWFNSSRMHFFTHVPKQWQGKSGLNFYADGMLQHDDHVGQLLDKLDELGIADNTIVLYTGDNGPHACTWPDAAVTWFRSEKVTNWEGAFRVPMLVRWPGKIKAGSVSNEIMAHLDWVPTLTAAAGDSDIKEKLKKGHVAGGKTFKVHLDGYNFLPHLMAAEQEGPRSEFLYFNDDAQLTSLRYRRWKAVFLEQRAEGQAVWRDMWVPLRAPKIFDLRMDPFEKADHDSNTYEDWWVRRVFLIVPAQPFVANFLKTFQEFPPSQKPAAFNLDHVMEQLYQSSAH